METPAAEDVPQDIEAIMRGLIKSRMIHPAQAKLPFLPEHLQVLGIDNSAV